MGPRKGILYGVMNHVLNNTPKVIKIMNFWGLFLILFLIISRKSGARTQFKKEEEFYLGKSFWFWFVGFWCF